MDNSTSQIAILASSVLTPLGLGVEVNFKKLAEKQSGIWPIEDKRFFDSILPLGKIQDAIIDQGHEYFNTTTRFDSLLLQCANDLKCRSRIDLSSKELIIILSTTKGNIELMESNPQSEKLFLSYSAHLIQTLFKNPNKPIIVSNACISGLSALIVAKRMIEHKHYKYAVVIGCDVLSKFVISGFNSFHALSKTSCKPFDLKRDGISLGEACAAVVLGNTDSNAITLQGGFISNDANHISGPSKSGEELCYCIEESMKQSNLIEQEIDFISAHGTATAYNDEMESKAFELAGLTNNPIFSLKANYGHTLGASGILETVISATCLEQNTILPSLGFEELGVSGNILMSKETQTKTLTSCIKTASGFGGCNASIILKKV